MKTDFDAIINNMPGLKKDIFQYKEKSAKKQFDRFVCRLCKRQRSYPIVDRKFYEDLDWECPDCYILIANKRYKINIKNGITVFSPMGFGLGDQIIQEVVRRRYLADNPDEDVIFLDEWSDDIWEEYKPDKVFWANLHSGGYIKSPGSMWFSLCNEANAFASQGHYPQFKFKLSDQELENLEPFKNSIVFHLRKIDKGAAINMYASEAKNVETHFVYAILTKLRELKVDKIALIGDDESGDGLDLKTIRFIIGRGGKLPIYDFRKRLTLNQIAWMCKNARLYIGKDSGPAHMAGAVGCQNMVVWGYQTSRYFPKVANGVCSAFTREDSDLEEVLDEIEKRFV